MGVLVKKLSEFDDPVHPFELIFVRMVMTWAVSVAYMSSTKVPHPICGPPGVRLLLVLRGFSGFVGLFGMYYSLQYLSLSDATVLSFLAPMCTAVTGALLLKEELTLRQVIASMFSFAGVVLIARPEFIFGRHAQDIDSPGRGEGRGVTPAQRIAAVGVALLGVVGATVVYTTIRAIGKRIHPMHSMVAFSSACIITSPVAMIVTRTPVVIPDNLPQVLMILGVSVCGFGGQMFMTTGLQRETAGRGTMAVYVQVVFALIFQRVFFHTTPPPLSIVGTAIILSSAIYVALTKRKASEGAGKGTSSSEDAELEECLLATSHDPDPEAGNYELGKVVHGLEPAEKVGQTSVVSELEGESKSGSSETVVAREDV